MQYYLVILGYNNVVFTENKVSDKNEAILEKAGFLHPDFKAIPIGLVLPQMSPKEYIVKNAKTLLS